MARKHRPPEDDDLDDNDEPDFSPVPRPAETDIEVDDFDDGLTIRVPPVGIWKGARPLLVMGILVCGFLTVFDTFILFAAANIKQGKADGLWIMLAFSALFWLLGIFCLLAAVNVGRRKA